MTYAKLQIQNPKNSNKSAKITFLIDSGATYSLVPKEILKQLEIKPFTKRDFFMANGECVERELGAAKFKYRRKVGYANVVFAEKGDEPLLGVTTLEAMGLGLNPLQRTIVPIKLHL